MEDVYRFSSAPGSSKTEENEMIRFGSPSFHLPVPWFIYSHRHTDREREREREREKDRGRERVDLERCRERETQKLVGLGGGGDGGEWPTQAGDLNDRCI